jgi:hypothetical protein
MSGGLKVPIEETFPFEKAQAISKVSRRVRSRVSYFSPSILLTAENSGLCY